MKMHPSITLERVMSAVERSNLSLDDPGFCIACGSSAYGVEPDVRNYRCESCGAYRVYGADELILHFVESIGEPEHD